MTHKDYLLPSFLAPVQKICFSNCYFPGTWCSPQRTYSICSITSVAKEYRSVDVYFITESVRCMLRTSTKHTGLCVSKASAWDKRKVKGSNAQFTPSSLPDLRCYPIPGSRVDPSPTAGLAVSAQPDALPGTETLSHLTFWFALCTLMTWHDRLATRTRVKSPSTQIHGAGVPSWSFLPESAAS